MEKFTSSESDRLAILYGEGFHGELTQEDIALIARFEKMKAESEAEYQDRKAALQSETQAKIVAAQSQADNAINGLNTLVNAALARLERIENGQEKQG